MPTVCPVDAECRFTEEVSDYRGLFVKEADKPIMRDLKAAGQLVKQREHHRTATRTAGGAPRR